MRTPYWDAIRALGGQQGRFYVPGHKGNPSAIPPFGGILPFDVTEIPGTGDLSRPEGALAQSQCNMAQAYGSGATLYSAGGSTSCILAMLTLFVPAGGRVIMARGCHASAVRALALLGATPVWVQPGTNGRVTPEAVHEALASQKADAVYLTSPDYFGRMADIQAMAPLCRKAGVPLLVDNAHGAHLRFVQPDIHPISLGADACADSAHKTLPCLTPAALLHLRDKNLARPAREALNLYTSTSPSHLVLASLDWAAGLLLDAPPDFAGTARRLGEIAAVAPHLVLPGDDPLKLCLQPSLAGVAYTALLDALRGAGLEPELADGKRIVLMASPYNTGQDMQRLAQVLESFPAGAAHSTAEEEPPPLPEQACTPREAIFGKKCRLPVPQALGRIVAEIAAPCPPGVPVVIPGEILGPPQAQLLLSGGILEIDVLK